jgi:hypothetical protein
MRSFTHEGRKTLHAETVADARTLARAAKRHSLWVPISPDESTEVDSSRAAILRALAGLDPRTPCGGVFSVTRGAFRLDTCG